MASPFDRNFDPTGAVRFDLRSGSASDSRGARLVLVPSSALELLSSEALAKIGEQIGRACGSRVAGIGAVHVERWGRALVAIVANASIADDAFVSAVLSGALSEAAGREVSAAGLGHEGNQARYFIGSAATSERVRGLASEGKGYAEIVASLQGGSS
jgi:hypothetical protein